MAVGKGAMVAKIRVGWRAQGERAHQAPPRPPPPPDSSTAQTKPTCAAPPLPRHFLLVLAVVAVLVNLPVLVPGQHAVERQRRRLHLAPLHRLHLQHTTRRSVLAGWQA